MRSGIDFVIESLTGTNNVAITDRTGIPSAMVRIPKFKISDVIEGGPDKTHPMFIVDGVEKEAIYIGKYEAVVDSGVAHSLAGRMPSNDVSIKQAIQATRAKGEGWHVMTNAEYAGVSLLSKANGTLPTGNDYMGQSNRGGARGILETEDFETPHKTAPYTGNYAGKTTFIPEQLGVFDINVEGAKKLHLRTFSHNTSDWRIEDTVGRIETITECDVPENAKTLRVITGTNKWDRTNENVLNLFTGRIMRSFRVFKVEETYYGFALILNDKDGLDLGYFTSKDGVKWSDNYTKVLDGLRLDNIRLNTMHTVDFDIIQHPKTKKWVMYMVWKDHIYCGESEKLTEGWTLKEIENKFKTMTSGTSVDGRVAQDDYPSDSDFDIKPIQIGLRPTEHNERICLHIVFGKDWHRIGFMDDSYDILTRCLSIISSEPLDGTSSPVNSIGAYVTDMENKTGISLEFVKFNNHLVHTMCYDNLWRNIIPQNPANIRIRDDYEITSVMKIGDEYFIYTTNVLKKHTNLREGYNIGAPGVELLKVGNPLIDETRYRFDTGEELVIAGSNSYTPNEILDMGHMILSNTVRFDGKFVRARMGRRLQSPPANSRWGGEDWEHVILEKSDDLKHWEFAGVHQINTYIKTWNNQKPKSGIRLLVHKGKMYLLFRLSDGGYYVSQFNIDQTNVLSKPTKLNFTGYPHINSDEIFGLNICDIDDTNHVITCYTNKSGGPNEGEYETNGVVRQWYYAQFTPENLTVTLKKINTDVVKFYIYDLLAVHKGGKFYLLYTFGAKSKADAAGSEGIRKADANTMYSHINPTMWNGIALLDNLDKPLDPWVGAGKLPIPAYSPHTGMSCTRYNGSIFTNREDGNELMITTMSSEPQTVQYHDSSIGDMPRAAFLYPVRDYFMDIATIKGVHKTGVEYIARRDISLVSDGRHINPAAKITIVEMREEPEYAVGDILTFENINRNIIFDPSNITRMRIEAVGAHFTRPNYTGGYTSGELDVDMLTEGDKLKISVGEMGCWVDHFIPFSSRGTYGGGGAGSYSNIKDPAWKTKKTLNTYCTCAVGAGASSVSIVSKEDANSGYNIYSTPEPDKEKLLMIAGGAGAETLTDRNFAMANPARCLGLIGATGYSNGSVPVSLGGTQTSGYKMGFGQNADKPIADKQSSGGGGGGFWGGTSYDRSAETDPNKIQTSDGGAGSSWVSGHPGCVNDLTPNSTIKLTNTEVSGSHNTTSKYFNPATMKWPETFARVTITVLETTDSKRDHKSVDEYFPGERFVFNGSNEKVHTFQTKNARRLRVECYGPRGAKGNDNCGNPGNGGYVSGDLIVTGDTALYPTIGSIGGVGKLGFNGGSAVTGSPNKKPYYGSGSVDVRTRKDDWRSRFIVAGAGGSASFMNDNILSPGSIGGDVLYVQNPQTLINRSTFNKAFTEAEGSGPAYFNCLTVVELGDKKYLYIRGDNGARSSHPIRFTYKKGKLIEPMKVSTIAGGAADLNALVTNGVARMWYHVADVGLLDRSVYMCSSNDGSSFGSPTRVKLDGSWFANKRSLCVYHHENGVYHAVYCTWSENDIYYCTSTDGVEFKTIRKLGTFNTPSFIGATVVDDKVVVTAGSSNGITYMILDKVSMAPVPSKIISGGSEVSEGKVVWLDGKLRIVASYGTDGPIQIMDVVITQGNAINGNPGGSLVPNGYENPVDYKISFGTPTEWISIEDAKTQLGDTNYDFLNIVRIRKGDTIYAYSRHIGAADHIELRRYVNGTWRPYEKTNNPYPGTSDHMICSAILVENTIHLFLAVLVSGVWKIFHYTASDDGKAVTLVGKINFSNEETATGYHSFNIIAYENGIWRATVTDSTTINVMYCESTDGLNFVKKHDVLISTVRTLSTIAYQKDRERTYIFYSKNDGVYFSIGNKDLSLLSREHKIADGYTLERSWNKTDMLIFAYGFIDPAAPNVMSVIVGGRYGTNYMEYRAVLDADSSKDDVIDIDFKITDGPVLSEKDQSWFTRCMITQHHSRNGIFGVFDTPSGDKTFSFDITGGSNRRDLWCPPIARKAQFFVRYLYEDNLDTVYATISSGGGIKNCRSVSRNGSGMWETPQDLTIDGQPATVNAIIPYLYDKSNNTHHAVAHYPNSDLIHLTSKDGVNWFVESIIISLPQEWGTVAIDEKRKELYFFYSPNNDPHIYYFKSPLYDVHNPSQPAALNLDPELIKENFTRSAAAYIENDTMYLAITASNKIYHTTIDLTKEYLVSPLRLFGNEDPIPGKTNTYVMGLLTPIKLGPQDYRIYYTAYDPLTPGPNNSVYMAKSDDGIVWHSHKKVIDYKEHIPAEWGAISGKSMTYMTLVNVFVHEGKFHAFLVDNTWDNRDVFLHCVSTDGENWERATFVSTENVPKIQSANICLIGGSSAKFYAPKHTSGILQVATTFNVFSDDRNLGAFTDVEFAPGGYVPTWISAVEVTLDPSTGVYHMVLFSFESKLNSRINVICKAESNDGIHFSKLEKIQSPQEWYSDMDPITHWREFEGRLYVHTSRVTDPTDPHHSVFALNAKDITAPVISEFRGEVQHFANVAESNIFDNTQFAPGGGGYIPGRSNHGVGDGGTSYIAGHPQCPDSYDGVVMTNPVVKPGVNDGEGKVIITVLETEETFKYRPGDRIWFNNIDEVATLEPKNATKIRLEAWGANKGDKKGGYAYAIYNVLDSEKQTLYAVAGSPKYNAGSSDFRTFDDPEVTETINKESRIMYAGYGDAESKSVYTPSTHIVLSNCGTIAGGNTFGYGNGVARASIVETDGKKRSVDSSIAYTGSGPITWSHNGEVTGIYDLVGNLHTLCLGLRINPTTGEPQVIQNNDAARYDMDFENEANWSAVNEHGEPVTKGSGVKYTNLSKTISIQDTAELRALGVVPDGNNWNVYTATGDAPIDVIYRGGAEDNPMSQASMFDVTAKAMDKNVIDRRMGFRICYYEP